MSIAGNSLNIVYINWYFERFSKFYSPPRLLFLQLQIYLASTCVEVASNHEFRHVAIRTVPVMVYTSRSLSPVPNPLPLLDPRLIKVCVCGLPHVNAPALYMKSEITFHIVRLKEETLGLFKHNTFRLLSKKRRAHDEYCLRKPNFLKRPPVQLTFYARI